MTTDHARQDLQTNGLGVRDVRPRDGRENTPRFFLEHRMATPDGKHHRDGHDDGNPRQRKNGDRTRTSRHFWCRTLTEPTPTKARFTHNPPETISLQPTISSILTTIHLRRTTMKKLTALSIILWAFLAHGENYVPTDAYGNRKYDQTNYKTEGDKLIPTDSFGNRQYGETNYKIDGDKLVPTDSFGNKKYDATAYRIKDNGHIEATDNFGNRKNTHEDFKMEGKKIVPVDSFGNRDYKRSGFVKQ
jgi:hypothetical protein